MFLLKQVHFFSFDLMKFQIFPTVPKSSIPERANAYTVLVTAVPPVVVNRMSEHKTFCLLSSNAFFSLVGHMVQLDPPAFGQRVLLSTTFERSVGGLVDMHETFQFLGIAQLPVVARNP